MKLHLVLAGLIASLCLAGSAVAAPTGFTWNLGPSTDLPGPVSGSYSFNSGGEVVNAYAYSSLNSDGSGKFIKQSVTLWDGGLGIHTSGESTSSPQHAADNDGKHELFIFEFDSADYIATGFQIGWNNGATGNNRPDIRVWVGGNSTIDFTDVCFSGCANTLASLAFQTYLFENVSVNTTLGLGSPGKYLIIAADSSWADGQSCTTRRGVTTCTPVFTKDYFKLNQITGTPGVPEPETLSLIALALLGAAASRRRS